ncbi:MAG: phosphate signaling complex protein PhoU [Anaerolineales bacterium]|nr:phosphate signaling complex protein PhoU [Anaerolineales bacterium]MCB9128532.1 phosphate signaling complex protein PhoU [Ardenticatenales bacterium]
MGSTRPQFDYELNRLDNRILRLGSLADNALGLALRSLLERDSGIARRVVEGDERINQLRYDIEEQAYQLFATQQPTAGDMRRVAAAISVATNLERMADHAAGIGVLALRLNREPALMPLHDFEAMAKTGRAMLRGAMDAYVNHDPLLARQVADQDAMINEVNEALLQELFAVMLHDNRAIQRATYLLWVARNLERWGDRVKNICERIIYIVSGQLTNFESFIGPATALEESALSAQDV